MKYIALIAAVAAVAACSPAEPEVTTDADATSVAEAAVVEQANAADGMPTPGTYEITNSQGEVTAEVINEDGTYTSTAADGTENSGTWEQRSPEEFCTQPADETEMKCFAETVDADGVWTSTDPDDGEVSTVVRIDTET